LFLRTYVWTHYSYESNKVELTFTGMECNLGKPEVVNFSPNQLTQCLDDLEIKSQNEKRVLGLIP